MANPTRTFTNMSRSNPAPRGTRRGSRALFAMSLTLLIGLAACSRVSETRTERTTSTGPTSTGASSTGASSTVTPPDGEDTTSTTNNSEHPYAGHASSIYNDGAAWICRPDLESDACRDLDATTIAADGTLGIDERSPASDAPIDCFYIYPTVASDRGSNSDLEFGPNDAETRTVTAQAAQFARTCRVFAPVYRQATLGAIATGRFPDARNIAFADVLDAWKTYISTWNNGRGVLLIGHSQGTGHLKKLIAAEIDNNEQLRSRLVGAYLFGGAIYVPEGEPVGGDFQNIPACEAKDQVGCVISWSTYPADNPPAPDARFGATKGDPFSEAESDERALCVNPLKLLDRDFASPVVPARPSLVGGTNGIEGIKDASTAFASLPDAIGLSCERTDNHDYLAASLADPDDSRGLNGLLEERLGPRWGLHLVDMTVALDDLVDLAAVQAKAFAD